jgi:hypothetical protein
MTEARRQKRLRYLERRQERRQRDKEGGTHMTVYGSVNLDIIGPGFTDDPGDPATGKPFIRLTFPDDTVVEITAHLAEMIGGAGRGATGRYNDLQRH